MPRITPLRVVLLPVFLYLSAVLLWVVLPCVPRVHSSNYSHYHQDVLRTGKTLTTVYENKQIYYTYKNDENTRRPYFAIDWWLEGHSEGGCLVLHIGTGSSINLTAYTNVVPPYVDWPISISTRAGELDGVMMPWFSEADASMLNWEINMDTQVIQLTLVVTEPGVIQLWPEDQRLHREPMNLPDSDNDLKPFVTISNIHTLDDSSDFSHIQVRDMTWDTPSLTFPMRRFILHALKPITLNVVGPVLEAVLFSGIIPEIMRVFVIVAFWFTAVTFACWFAAGRPAFDKFTRTFPLTRWMYRTPAKKMIYGPTGFIAEVDDEDEFGGPKSVDRQQPQALRGVTDFFRSRSPLDDLCATFECTKWLLRPIGRQRPHTYRRFEPSDGIADSAVEEGKVKLQL